MGKKTRSDKTTRPEPTKTGPLAFDNFYHQMIGSRWETLQPACRAPVTHFQLQTGLRKPYFLDPASVFAALHLSVQPGQTVLDLCAAPGGKSLVLAQQLFGLVEPNATMAERGMLVAPLATAAYPEDSETDTAPTQIPDAAEPAAQVAFSAALPASTNNSRLVANERSAARRGRLRSVLNDHLPETCHPAISVYGHDASAWGQYQQDIYDRILLDVPCSSERHLIMSPSYLEDWSPGRTKQLAQQAYAMGLSAARALKHNGLLLYCTCALSTLENDQTIIRIVERSQALSSRFGFHLEIDAECFQEIASPPYLELERTTYGAQIWPDRGQAFGPLYFCRLRKVRN